MPTLIDLTGQKFGRLIAQWPAGRGGKSNMFVYWLCLCSCGKLSIVTANKLRTEHTRSCGCLQSDLCAKRSIGNSFGQTHGHTSNSFESPEYTSWKHMIQRCTNSRNKRWRYYGGSGVQVCARWNRFENFLKDMGSRPAHTSLGRFGDIGNYEPGNCKWMTQKEQIENKNTMRLRLRRKWKARAS
jgi:hypothetical protein